jgi:lipoyltransferase and lipoate-protein ligase
MIFIKHDNTNPCINHAIEEYALNKFDDDCFILWRNEPCILIGKNQNTLSEINIDYVKEHSIPVVRRMSGGGAIFCDLGNILFTFISKLDENNFADFSKFTNPIISALEELSIKAELSGRNDLTIDGRKFSGNAQYNSKNKTLHHGSILFSSAMSDLIKALKVKEIKFQDKAIKSVASRVTNISEHLKEPMSVIEFKEFLNNYIINEYGGGKFYEFSDEEWAEIRKISDEKYATWEWTYGHSPKFSYSDEKKFLGGIVQANINVHKGLIKEIRFYGDFFSKGEVKELEELLTGVRYLQEDVDKVFNTVDIEKYMSNVTKENLLEIMFQ